ncbi:unnamed protein product [Rotaria sordida]|uniref:Uncharacterized protein n=1 Tax=Rotaria sordida TaxID=392033 RepID=A0A816AUP3_9BILA|nr:unnamed protein product [Rotaria sordida]CAF1601072.1 unnamed protein product [Rotaria sordida]
MSDDKITSDSPENRETLEELSSGVTKKDITATMKYDKNRRLTMKPFSNRHKKFGDNKSSDEGSSYGEPEDEDAFDAFILNNFSPFSGNENVIEWLDITDEKFNIFEISRNLRCLAIPLLVKGDAKRTYINDKNKINTTFEANDSLPQPPILRSTALLDLGATSLSGDDPVNRSNVASCQNIFLSSSILDQTAYALRRGIVDSLIKNPKTFRGGKDDVKHIAKSLLGQT